MDIRLLGTEPVPDGAPSGRDAKYEPEYGIVLGEIEKLGSATQGGSISWPLVADTCALILREQSKDFLIAAYLAAALFETRGTAGLTDGVVLLGDFLENWWDDAFPPLKRLRGRINALDWWRDRAVDRLLAAATTVPPLPAAAFQDLLDAVERLDKLLGERLPDFSPLNDLVQAVRRLPVEAASEILPSADSACADLPSAELPGKEATVPVHPAGASAAPASPPPQDSAGWRSLFLDTARDFAFAGHEDAPEDPLPWQALRQAVWGKVWRIPPAEGHVTRIPAPDPARLDGLRGLIASGRALEAALGAENFFPESMFWLDIQHVAGSALAALGPEFAEALTVVREETARLLRRLPGLELYSFSDGTPFAREETRRWLAGLVSGPEQNRRISGSTEDGEGTAEDNAPGKASLEEATRTAEGLYARGDLRSALRALEAAQGPGGRRNLLLRVAQLRLLARASSGDPGGGDFATADATSGHSAWKNSAFALAGAVLEDVITYRLEQWEPELALEALACVPAALGTAGPGAENARQDALRRMARISPSALVDGG